MICIHQNNIQQDLELICDDDTLIHFLEDDTIVLNITSFPLMKSYIFKRLNYLGTVLDMKISKKILEKRVIF